MPDDEERNTNKDGVGAIEQAKREQMKDAHDKKVTQDKESTAKAKADKEKNKGKNTQKKEKQRGCG